MNAMDLLNKNVAEKVSKQIADLLNEQTPPPRGPSPAPGSGKILDKKLTWEEKQELERKKWQKTREENREKSNEDWEKKQEIMQTQRVGLEKNKKKADAISATATAAGQVADGDILGAMKTAVIAIATGFLAPSVAAVSVAKLPKNSEQIMKFFSQLLNKQKQEQKTENDLQLSATGPSPRPAR